MPRNQTHSAPGDGGITDSTLADREAVLHPQAAPMIDTCLLTRSRVVLMGSGDQRPPVRRPGSMDFAALPSVMGGRLIHPEPQP